MQGGRIVALSLRAKRVFWVRWIVFDRNVEVIDVLGLMMGLHLNIIKREIEHSYEVLRIPETHTHFVRGRATVS